MFPAALIHKHSLGDPALVNAHSRGMLRIFIFSGAAGPEFAT